MRRQYPIWNAVTMPEGKPDVIRLDGPIASEAWWDDDSATPASFRQLLDAHPGDLVVYINSPGGEVVAATEMYTMLKEHPGRVTVKIDGIAASAASVVAMAGDEVYMAPTAYMMIHNALSLAAGNKDDMRHEADVLEEIDKGIRTAYRLRTGLSDAKLERMMTDETWMSAATAVALGFADGISGAEPEEDPEEDPEEPQEPLEEEEGEEEEEQEKRGIARTNLHGLPYVAYSGRMAANELMAGIRRKLEEEKQEPMEPVAAEEKADAIEKLRLRLLSY